MNKIKFSMAIDLDGVCADYESGIEAMGFEIDRSLNRSSHLLPGSGSEKKRLMYEAIKGTTFYATLPILPDAVELFRSVLTVDDDPIILTAAPKFGATEDDYLLNPYWLGAAYHKRWWCENVFLPEVYGQKMVRLKDTHFICTTSSRKQEFMHRKHSEHQILIDDRIDNINAWNNAGGIGILYTDAQSAIAKLFDIVEIYS